MRHWTEAGKVIYKRDRHEFSVTDATRIIRNLDPMPIELPKIIPFAIEVKNLFVRGVFSVMRVSTDAEGNLRDTAGVLVGIVEELYKVAETVSGDFAQEIKDKFRAITGQK
jgi:hypothetical protein